MIARFQFIRYTLSTMIRDVTDLQIYILSLDQLEKLYKITRVIPPQHRKLKYQLNEAAEKIAPQIAEGFGKKKSAREFCRFLAMAIGSSDEVITHLREVKIIAKVYTKISLTDCDDMIGSYKVLSKKINKLHTAWQHFT